MDKVKSFFLACWKSIKQMGADIVDTFKYKPWTICTILFMVPGLFIGLFLQQHFSAATNLPQEYGYAGILLFGVMMLGCINIFNAFSYASKRSMFMAVFSTVVTVLLTLCCIFYDVMYFKAIGEGHTSFSGATAVTIIVVSFSTICAVAASVLTYFFIDKERVKE